LTWEKKSRKHPITSNKEIVQKKINTLTRKHVNVATGTGMMLPKQTEVKICEPNLPTSF